MRRFLILATLGAAIGATAQIRAADVIIGDFEGTPLEAGFTDWQGGATFASSTVGVTHGAHSIRVEPGALGFYQGLTVKIQNLPNNAEVFDGFLANTHVAVDVTFDPADFAYTGEGWNGGRLLMFYNEQGAGWQGNIGVDIGDANGFRVPNVDTGNPTNPGFWDIGNYPTVHTRTMMWDYSAFKAANTSSATGGWLEFIIGNNLGNFNAAALHFDNLRFTTPSVALQAADFNADGSVNNLDLAIWSPNVGATGQTNNSLGDADANGLVDGGDVLVWQRQLVQGGGSLPAIGAIPEPATIVLIGLGLGGAAMSRRRR